MSYSFLCNMLNLQRLTANWRLLVHLKGHIHTYMDYKLLWCEATF